MAYEIVIAPAKVLTRPARRLDKVDSALLEALWTGMLETVEGRGVGLAAPQVGESVRFFIAWNPETKDFHPFVNPQIISTSQKREVASEGCLSIPGFYANVERHVDVVLRWQDLEFKQQEGRFSAYHARIIQHELDHLNGVLLFDRAVDGMHPEAREEEDEVGGESGPEEHIESPASSGVET